jgi:S1-C subfamily serine protease
MLSFFLASVSQVVGSSFVVSKDYLITCKHVVDKMKTIELHLNGRVIKAKVKAISNTLDLALLEADTKDLVPVSFEKSYGLGDLVFLFGFPDYDALEESPTITQGIISRLWKSGRIQTDASLNPGCSGALLINKSGNIIGIVSSKHVEDSVDCIGFCQSVEEILSFLSKEKVPFTLAPSKETLSASQIVSHLKASIALVMASP